MICCVTALWLTACEDGIGRDVYFSLDLTDSILMLLLFISLGIKEKSFFFGKVCMPHDLLSKRIKYIVNIVLSFILFDLRFNWGYPFIYTWIKLIDVNKLSYFNVYLYASLHISQMILLTTTTMDVCWRYLPWLWLYNHFVSSCDHVASSS